VGVAQAESTKTTASAAEMTKNFFMFPPLISLFTSPGGL
jgi:hypothetical protein